MGRSFRVFLKPQFLLALLLIFAIGFNLSTTRTSQNQQEDHDPIGETKQTNHQSKSTKDKQINNPSIAKPVLDKKNNIYECLIDYYDLKDIADLGSKLTWEKDDLRSISDHFIATRNGIEGLASKSDCNRNVMMYQCHNGICGGFGDRVRGFLHTFYWSLAVGYQFQAWWDHPVDVFDYFEPLASITSTEEAKHGNAHQIYLIDNFNEKTWYSDYVVNQVKGHNLVKVMANTYFWYEIINNKNIDPNLFLIYPYLRDLSGEEMAFIGMKMYFSNPTRYLKEAFDKTFKKFDSKWFKIGIQHRSGDSKFGGNANRHSIHSAECFGQKALELCKESKLKKCMFFVTSDNPSSIDLIRKNQFEDSLQIDVIVSQGEALHIDKPQHAYEDMKATYLKTFLDWYSLSQMDALVISRSGFGETAAWASFKPALRYSTADECKFLDYHELTMSTRDYGLGVN